MVDQSVQVNGDGQGHWKLKGGAAVPRTNDLLTDLDGRSGV